MIDISSTVSKVISSNIILLQRCSPIGTIVRKYIFLTGMHFSLFSKLYASMYRNSTWCSLRIRNWKSSVETVRAYSTIWLLYKNNRKQPEEKKPSLKLMHESHFKVYRCKSSRCKSKLQDTFKWIFSGELFLISVVFSQRNVSQLRIISDFLSQHGP